MPHTLTHTSLPLRELENYNKRGSANPRAAQSQDPPERSSASSWYPTNKNNHTHTVPKGCSGEKGLLYQLQSNPVSLH